ALLDRERAGRWPQEAEGGRRGDREDAGLPVRTRAHAKDALARIREAHVVRRADVEGATHIQGRPGTEHPAGRVEQEEVRPGEVRGLDRPLDPRHLTSGDATQDVRNARPGRVAEVRDVAAADAEETEAVEQVAPGARPAGDVERVADLIDRGTQGAPPRGRRDRLL